MNMIQLNPKDIWLDIKINVLIIITFFFVFFVLFVVGYLQVISLLLLGEYNAYRHLIRKLFAGTKAIGLLALGVIRLI